MRPVAVPVRLSYEDEEWATDQGYRRHLRAWVRGRERDGIPGATPSRPAHKLGFACEVAAARHYGFSLESLVETEWAKFHAAPDVGTAHDGFNVRGTANPRGGLPIRQDDDEACPWPYLLVISFGDRWYHIMGWAFGPEIRKPHFWREDIPRPTWIMPQHALHDPVTLPVGAMT